MVSFTTPMPASTQRAHARGAEWKGDRLLFINHVSHMPLGRDRIRAVDLNFWGIWNAHWGVPLLDNYHYVEDEHTGRVRKMTHAELHRHIDYWHDGAKRWRRGPHADSPRPHTYREIVHYAADRDVVVCAENKRIPTVAECVQMHADAKAADHPPFHMAMLRQRLRASTDICETKCERHIEAGNDFAVIHGRGPLGAANRRISGHTTAGWSPRPTRIW